MSTRCCVKVIKSFEGKTAKTAEVMLYHHYDGYPEGVGADLVERSAKWSKTYPERGWDIDDIVNGLVKDDSDCYEYTAYNHIDIEYLYTIDCNNMTIKCNEAHWRFGTDEKGEQYSFSEIGKEVEIPVGGN